MWPDSEETRELLTAAHQGDEGAVEGLMGRHREALRRMVHLRMDRGVGRRVDASDIVQDVLLEASQRLRDYLEKPVMPFHLWLRKLAKDRMVDMIRRHRGAQRRSIDREQPLRVPSLGDRSSLDLAAQLADAELTPAAATIRRELQLRFHEALDQLADDDHDILLMRHFEHLTNSEAAQALELSPPAAGMRHLRALRRLKAILANDPGQ